MLLASGPKDKVNVAAFVSGTVTENVERIRRTGAAADDVSLLERKRNLAIVARAHHGLGSLAEYGLRAKSGGWRDVVGEGPAGAWAAAMELDRAKAHYAAASKLATGYGASGDEAKGIAASERPSEASVALMLARWRVAVKLAAIHPTRSRSWLVRSLARATWDLLSGVLGEV